MFPGGSSAAGPAGVSRGRYSFCKICSNGSRYPCVRVSALLGAPAPLPGCTQHPFLPCTPHEGRMAPSTGRSWSPMWAALTAQAGSSAPCPGGRWPVGVSGVKTSSVFLPLCPETRGRAVPGAWGETSAIKSSSGRARRRTRTIALAPCPHAHGMPASLCSLGSGRRGRGNQVCARLLRIRYVRAHHQMVTVLPCGSPKRLSCLSWGQGPAR